MFSVHYYKNLANSKGVVWSSKMKTLLRAKRGTEFQGQPSLNQGLHNSFPQDYDIDFK